MQEYDELGELIDLLLLVSYHGISASNDEEGIAGVATLPQKGHYPEGLSVKNEQAYRLVGRIERDLAFMRARYMEWFERSIGTN